MNLNEFPSTPYEGQQLLIGNVTYQYTGGVWNVVSAVKTNLRVIAERLAKEAGLNMVAGSFDSGATVAETTDVIWDEFSGKYYAWGGTIPKVVPAGSTPATSGGIGAGAWVDRTDLTLRGELAERNSSVIIADVDASSIAQASLLMHNAIATAYYITDEELDYTSVMQSIVDSGKLIYVNHGFLAKITGYINFDSISLIGDRASGFLLDSQEVDAIFKPNITATSFIAKDIKAKALRYNNNRPYLCSTDDGTDSPLTYYEVVGCHLYNIGESAEMARSEHSAISMRNVIESDDNTDEYCSMLTTAYPRAWQRYQVNYNTLAYDVNTERYGNYTSTLNLISVFGQSGDNKDLAKYTGLSESYTIKSNTYINRNVNSDSEVDTYMGLCFATVAGNKFRNVSLKTMKNLNGGDPALAGVGLMSSISDNILRFDEGARINKGILAKPDLCSYIGNKVMYRCLSDVTDFSGIKIEQADTITYFGLNPSCNIFTGNIVDVTCGASTYRRTPIERISMLRGSICNNNIFIGGAVALAGDRGTLLTSNVFVNTVINDISGRLDAAFSGGGNLFLAENDGVFSDSSKFQLSLTNSGGYMMGSFAAPWYSDDRREWVISIETTSTLGTNNWQTFRLKANPNSQTVSQSSGRLPLTASDAPALENIFNLSVTTNSVTVKTTTLATKYYPSTISVFCKQIG